MRKKAPRRAAPRARPAVALVIEEKRWRRDVETVRLIRRAARLALTANPRLERRKRETFAFEPSFPRKGEHDSPERVGRGAPTVTILLAGDGRLKSLNSQFRGRNKATNVLSFAGESSTYLGDVAIAYETTAREARAQRKRFSAHAAHLVVHGILHLFGYDHEKVRQASAMETLETALLASLGLSDPYAPRPLTRRKKAA